MVCAASGTRRTKPASTKPMKAMNRPIPTEIATFSCDGTAWKTAFRKPVSTSTRMTRPSITISPIAAAQVICGAIATATKAFRPEPGRQRERVVRPRRPSGSSSRRRRAPCRRRSAGRFGAVAGATAEVVAVRVGREPEDQRVQHDDVGHREEGDEATAELTLDGRATVADLEEPVEATRGRRGSLRRGVGPPWSGRRGGSRSAGRPRGCPSRAALCQSVRPPGRDARAGYDGSHRRAPDPPPERPTVGTWSCATTSR